MKKILALALFAVALVSCRQTMQPDGFKPVSYTHINYERDIYLQVQVTGGGICYFSYRLDGRKYTSAGVPCTARQCKWIGAKVGLFSTAPYGKERGWVDADWFRINK